MTTQVTVWFDGACPLCQREIALFRKLDGQAARIAFIDVSAPDAAAFCPLDRAELLARFHAQEAGQPLVSGADALLVLWRSIPLFAPVGHLARIPPLLWLLERLYRAFLRIRPRLQRLVKPA
jgi:predicted DCC family thiol-disulfide oxidoreductase YuxK